jgi:hypothetical protein
LRAHKGRGVSYKKWEEGGDMEGLDAGFLGDNLLMVDAILGLLFFQG